MLYIRRAKRYIIKLTVHAVMNSKIRTFAVLFVPSSRLSAATAATHGILSSEKLINAHAACGDIISDRKSVGRERVC